MSSSSSDFLIIDSTWDSALESKVQGTSKRLAVILKGEEIRRNISSSIAEYAIHYFN